MKPCWDFLTSEIRGPVRALKTTLIFLIQFTALLFLRLVLWLTLFFLPMIILLLTAFHLTAHQVRKEYTPSNPRLSNVNPLDTLRSKVLSLESVKGDVAFWLSEFKRFMK